MPHFSGSSPGKSNVNSNTEAREQHIRARNRRKRFLDLNPDYFAGSNLELADPLLYDRLIRRFLTASEREEEGRQRGFARSMEADLMRSEAKLDALRNPDPNSPISYRRAADGSIIEVEVDEDDRVQTREDGVARWKDVMGQRFMRGDDKDFDYKAVDENDMYDDHAEEDRYHLERYLDGQDEEFVGDGSPKGETGIQDF
ncbi:hypothetical protein M433DRAFT_133663 [Acidomyces richmondensis BFW]|nr:MAG: hypothetical protein FE78DRAFT_69617 [Acidomyces sp. 'richmondensis']KYG46658.1 hypothetical protein M433DRAFT_133663 [Acidomyces richmondensis BFW]